VDFIDFILWGVRGFFGESCSDSSFALPATGLSASFSHREAYPFLALQRPSHGGRWKPSPRRAVVRVIRASCLRTLRSFYGS